MDTSRNDASHERMTNAFAQLDPDTLRELSRSPATEKAAIAALGRVAPKTAVQTRAVENSGKISPHVREYRDSTGLTITRSAIEYTGDIRAAFGHCISPGVNLKFPEIAHRDGKPVIVTHTEITRLGPGESVQIVKV